MVTATTLPPLIEAMTAPGFYPDPADRVELRQTHTSFVLLASDFAYKVRKPVVLPFIDCGTPAKRKTLCEQENKINRRLAPDIYLGVIPIVYRAGRYHFDQAAGDGAETVDFALKMRRLPDDRRLDQLIETRRVRHADIQAIAQRLADFHRGVSRRAAWTYGSAAQVWQLIIGNLSEVRDLAADTLTHDRLTAIGNFSRRFVAARWEFINQRARDGRVCDGHGDLRCDSVYLLADGIRIIDALEFSERLRYCDVAADVGFLAVDLDRLGRPELAEELVRAYALAVDDYGLAVLLPLYKCYRATVRAKVELIRSRQADCPVDERVIARERARGYLELARTYTETSSPQGLVVVCGLSGTGKSTLAQALHEKTGFPILASDAERKRLAGVPAAARLESRYGEDAYSDDFTRRVYESLISQAETLLRAGSGVILDATFRRRDERALVVEMARRCDLEPIFVECRAEKSEVIRRLIERGTRLNEISDATVEIYLAQLRDFEELTEVPSALHIVAKSDETSGSAPVLAAIERRIHANN
jgi:aminoglycoside phosphotransferase family enzyme/predicted kinase